MTDKQIIKPRPICLYQDTCLHLKEKTRVCEDCVHHKNYWSELLAKDQAEKIKKLEQECEELKKDYTTAKSMYDLCQSDFMELAKIKDNYKQALLSIKNIATDTELFLMDKNYQIIQIIKGVLKDEV